MHCCGTKSRRLFAFAAKTWSQSVAYLGTIDCAAKRGLRGLHPGGVADGRSGPGGIRSAVGARRSDRGSLVPQQALDLAQRANPGSYPDPQLAIQNPCQAPGDPNPAPDKNNHMSQQFPSTSYN
jgi:hypothetical protein